MNATNESTTTTVTVPTIPATTEPIVKPSGDKATRVRVGKAIKADKATANEKPVKATKKAEAVAETVVAEPKMAKVRTEDPRRNEIRALIAKGKGVSEIARALGCRRGIVRRTLIGELAKVGATYTTGARLVDGKAIVAPVTGGGRKGTKRKAEPTDYPVAFAIRNVDLDGKTAIELYHLASGTAMGRLRKSSVALADQAVADANRIGSYDKAKVAALAAGTGHEAQIAKGVLKVAF